jgi:uncharacterized DUF497 family protein
VGSSIDAEQVLILAKTAAKTMIDLISMRKAHGQETTDRGYQLLNRVTCGQDPLHGKDL